MVDYLIHKRGRGLIIDDAEVNLSTYLDRKSSVGGSAKLRDCKLIDSHASDTAQVYGGRYERTQIRGRTICAGNPQVINSTLFCSEVSGTPLITDSDLFGGTEVCDSPTLNGIIAQDAIIYGSPSLIGTFEVTGRVHEGHWTRAPKHIKLPWVDISECVDGKVLLNCYCRPATFWLRHGPRIAHKWDWSEDMIAVTLETIEREFINGGTQVGHQFISPLREAVQLL